MRSKFRGCLLGLAVGDAVGTTLEFRPRGSFLPINDMVGGGPFCLPAGKWTDDTSMALCLAESLLEFGFDPGDQMRRYCDWHENGYMSSTGYCFDIGNTVLSALNRYRKTGVAMSGYADGKTAGNGSIMRLAPVCMYYFGSDEAEYFAAESSKTTHGAIESVDACRMLGGVISRALSGASKMDALLGGACSIRTPSIQSIACGDYLAKSEDEISGSGYVVQSLEAALWSVAITDNFRDAVLAAANLGDDADTTAAVCGQVAGALYGVESIPESWVAKLHMKNDIISMADRLMSKAA